MKKVKDIIKEWTKEEQELFKDLIQECKAREKEGESFCGTITENLIRTGIAIDSIAKNTQIIVDCVNVIVEAETKRVLERVEKDDETYYN